jgi:hypothetical protein
VVEGHQAANLIEAAIETELPDSDVVVHVEPRRSGLELDDSLHETAVARFKEIVGLPPLAASVIGWCPSPMW